MAGMGFVKTRKTKTSTKHRRGDCPPDDGLGLLEQRLGIEPGRIAKLRGESDGFAEICADYEECCSKLRSLKQNTVSAGMRVRDYEEMRDQLEWELERHLKGADPQRTNGRRTEQGKTG